MPDAELIALLERTALALDEEAAWLIDVETDDRGGSRGIVPVSEWDYYEALTEESRSLRELALVIKSRAS